MELTIEQISALAPDSSSLSAGKKLATPKDWKSTGRREHCQREHLVPKRGERLLSRLSSLAGLVFAFVEGSQP